MQQSSLLPPFTSNITPFLNLMIKINITCGTALQPNRVFLKRGLLLYNNLSCVQACKEYDPKKGVLSLLYRDIFSWQISYKIHPQQKIFYNRSTIAQHLVQNSGYLSNPLPFYVTQTIDPVLYLRILANYDKGQGFQLIVKSLYHLMFLQCRISFP